MPGTGMTSGLRSLGIGGRARQIDARDIVEKIGTLRKNAGGHFDVRLLFDSIGNAGRHAAAHGDNRTAGSSDQNVGADATRPAGLIIQHSIAQADQGENHGHLNSDSKHAQQRPDGTMPQVFDNEFIDQSTFRIRLSPMNP